MNISELKKRVNRDPKLKRTVHRMLISPRKTTPRLWVKLFVNPFFSKRGKGSVVKLSARLNVTPINRFVLGRRSVVENRCVIDNGVGDVIVGADSRIGIANTIIGPIKIGDKVITAQNVVLSGLNHNYLDADTPIREQGVTAKPIVIEDDVWIGAGAVITAGVTIGRHSIVAAGSVVTKPIPSYSVFAGVPAKMIKYYDHASGQWRSPDKRTV